MGGGGGCPRTGGATLPGVCSNNGLAKQLPPNKD